VVKKGSTRKTKRFLHAAVEVALIAAPSTAIYRFSYESNSYEMVKSSRM